MGTSVAEVIRTGPDGSRLTVALPAAAGEVAWHGLTKLSGPNSFLSVSLSPAGEHRSFRVGEFEGGRAEVFRRRGYDLHVYESADRADSALVWVGPYNEASTMFSGPAPQLAVLNRMASMVDFADSAHGATITPKPGTGLQQHESLVVGWGEQIVVMVRDAAGSRAALPEWQGHQRGDAEIWKRPLDLPEDQAAAVAGSPYESRYTIANSSAAFDVIFPSDPDGPRLRGARADRWAEEVLAGIAVTRSGAR